LGSPPTPLNKGGEEDKGDNGDNGAEDQGDNGAEDQGCGQK